MPGYKSELSYNQLKAIADAGAINRISDGTCRRNKDKWQGILSYQVDDPSAKTGKRQERLTRTFLETRVTGRGSTTRPQAMRLVAAWREQVIADARQVAGLTADPTCSVRACISQFIDDRENVGKIRSSTATFYRNSAKRIYRHPIASLPLQDLTKPMVQSLVGDLSKTLAGKTVKDSYDILDTVCREMLGHDHNPCNGVTLPRLTHNSRTKSSRPNALSYDGVARCNSLIDAREAKSSGTDLVMLGARIALFTGMRVEETTGLRWRDVDLKARTIRVCNVIERAEIPKRDSNGSIIYGEDGNPKATYATYDAAPKTENSERDIPIAPELAEELSMHRAYVRGLIADRFPNKKQRPNIGDLYVLGDLNGKHMSPHRLGVNWSKFAKKNGIIGTERKPISYHDLRHSFATRSIAAGIDVATVSRILGHASITVTFNRYVNSDEETKRAAIERMADVLSMRQQPAREGVTPFRAGSAG